MKVKEFSEKYQVDYNTVYCATAAIPLGRNEGPYEYSEADMLIAVRSAAERRKNAAEISLERSTRILKNCSTPEAMRIIRNNS